MKPAITGTTHTLPFNKLSPLDFERLCLWLVEREGYERAEHLGAGGSEQGRDVTAWRGDELWYFQCKRYRSIGAGTLRGEVDKYLQLVQEKPHLKPAGVVFVTSCIVSAQARGEVGDYCVGNGLDYEFWAETELDAKVKRHPDIVEEFFQVADRDVLKKLAQLLGFSPHEQRAPELDTLLKRVKRDWIQGVLERSLHGAAAIELGLEECAGAVDSPWDAVLQLPDRSGSTLPRGTRIVDVFEEMSQALLILGQPGSGKTTMLLELARDTIARAEQYPAQPVPVVFNLSTWAVERQSIAEWLIGELNVRFYIPREIARSWVENDELLLLLDGLDEVRQEHREACAEAINRFRLEHGLAPIAVCSRVEDYGRLNTRLKLGAILLQPLTSEQIDEYIERAGAELSAVREALQHDAGFRGMVDSPLMLNIMTMAYRGMPTGELQPLDSVAAHRKHVLDAYTGRMFERRGEQRDYSPEQTMCWLAWLAHRMSQHSQRIFSIEQLQPSWLSRCWHRWIYVGVSRVVAGVILGLPVALTIDMLAGALIGGLGGLVVAITDGVRFERRDRRARQDVGTSRRVWMRRIPVIGLSVGLAAMLTCGLLLVLNQEIREILGNLSLAFTLAMGLVIGVVFEIAFGRGDRGQGLRGDVKTVDAISWSWKKAGRGAGIGLVLGLIFGVIQVVMNELPLDESLLVGPPFGVLFGLMGAAIGGLRGKTVEDKATPNWGTWSSARNGLFAALALGLPTGLGVALVDQMINPPFSMAGFVGSIRDVGLPFGLIVGSISLLRSGAYEFVKHFALRLLLWLDGHTPWNYARLLDRAAERILLYKVGGGYMFIHPLMQEYFASLYEVVDS
jgi:hypothetical protein